MIILDTNVVAEPMKADGNPAVLDWLNRQAADTLFLTTVNLAELLLGIAYLPNGRRKKGLDMVLTELLDTLFGTRILSFDQAAAKTFGPLMVRAHAAGRAVSVADGQIAAIAAANGFTVATRDTMPFEAVGVPVINPFE